MWAMKLWDEGYKRLSQEMMAQRLQDEDVLVRGGSAGLAETGARGINLQGLSRSITNLVAPMPAANRGAGDHQQGAEAEANSSSSSGTEVGETQADSSQRALPRMAAVSTPEDSTADHGRRHSEQGADSSSSLSVREGPKEVLAMPTIQYSSEPTSPQGSSAVKKSMSHGLLVVNTELELSRDLSAATDTAAPPFHQTQPQPHASLQQEHHHHQHREQQPEAASQPAHGETPAASPRTPMTVPHPSPEFGSTQALTLPLRPHVTPQHRVPSPPPPDTDPDLDPDPEAQHTPWERPQPGPALTPPHVLQQQQQQQPAGWGAPLVPVNLSGQLRPTVEALSAGAPCDNVLSVGSLEVDLAEVSIGHIIGEGGFGKVYLSTFRGRQVAIKVQSGLECSKASVLEEFKREVTTMHTLPHHRNVLSLLGACTVPPRLSIITEYCARGSLYTLLHTPGCHLSWAQIVYMLLGAALGMVHLHRSNVLHRDLKSANLLVDEHYTVKVADFGLSRVQSNLTTMTGGLGTYQWMAPEVLGNQRYSEKADVYSFGIVMWECTAREVPYAGMQGMQAAMAVMNRGLRPEIPPHTPPPLADLIRASWRPVPSMRPNMAEVAATLKDIYHNMRSSSSSRSLKQ